MSLSRKAVVGHQISSRYVDWPSLRVQRPDD